VAKKFTVSTTLDYYLLFCYKINSENNFKGM
jgi:hypothetical protein